MCNSQSTYATIKQRVKMRLGFFAFKGGYSSILPEISFKFPCANGFSNTSSTFFYAIYLNVYRNKLTLKLSDFSSNMAATINFNHNSILYSTY